MRIDRQRRIHETIANVIFNIIFYAFVAVAFFFIAWFTIGVDEVETYTFHAEITDKAVTDEYRHATEYLIFWCDGEEAGCDEVAASTYARYRIGDLIEVEATVKQDWFGTEFTRYNLTGN
jgi:hypothetical protein